MSKGGIINGEVDAKHWCVGEEVRVENYWSRKVMSALHRKYIDILGINILCVSCVRVKNICSGDFLPRRIEDENVFGNMVIVVF